MPKHLHDLLDKRAKELGFKKGSDSYNRYVFGTLAKHEKRKKDGKENKD